MKLRGINPIERHAEKIFLGLIGLVFLGVIAMQFVGSGGTVSVGGESNVPLERAYADVASDAERKLAQVNSPQVDERVPQSIENVAARFESMLERGVAPRDELAIWMGRPSVGEAGMGNLDVDELLVELPELPQPATPTAAAFAGTLNPLVVDDELRVAAPYLPAQQPFDLRWTTIESTYDARALVRAFQADPAGEASAIPEYWWRQSLEVLAVEVERREESPTDGTGPVEQVAPWPSGPNLLGAAQSAEDRAALQNVIVQAQRSRRDVIRPAFYQLIAGEPWAPPSVAAESSADQARIDRLLREKQEAMAELERLDQRAMRDAFENVVAQSGRPGGQPGDRGGSQSRGGDDRDDQREEILKQRKDELEGRIEQINASLKDLGVDPQGRPLRDPVQAILEEPAPRPVDGGTMRLWSHDLGVRPGATYSYRIRVHVPNPLYGNGPNLAEEIRDLASEPTLVSPWSGWSTPTRIEADAYLFIAGASRGGALGGAATREIVTADLYSFFYGYWRRHTARLTPGDAVTGRLDLSELSLPEFEIERDGTGAYVAARSTMQGTRSLGAEGWYLLDVAPAAVTSAGEDPEEMAILRDPEGRLVIRRERDDRRSELRERLQRNAELGRTAQVDDPMGEEAPRRETAEREDRQDDRRPGGGGVGGGPR